MKKAFIFPGQGSQKIGMGKEVAITYPVAKQVFEAVDDALGQNLSRLIWEGDIKQLTQTENAQPALMANSIAVLAAMKAEGLNIKKVDFVAGHSLGEYTALCAAESITVYDSARLLKTRGRAMQACDKNGDGSMAAILGLNSDIIMKIVDEVSGEKSCQLANDNDPAQNVISGHRDAVEKAIELARIKGAKKVVILNVSAPFHSSMMVPAQEVMRNALSSISISKPVVPVVMNTKATEETEPNKIREILVEQVAGMVRWRESINFMIDRGINTFFELGEGKALSGMVKRICRSVETVNVSSASDVIKSMERLSNETR